MRRTLVTLTVWRVELRVSLVAAFGLAVVAIKPPGVLVGPVSVTLGWREW